jgi:hypothetical protein
MPAQGLFRRSPVEGSIQPKPEPQYYLQTWNRYRGRVYRGSLAGRDIGKLEEMDGQLAPNPWAK